MNIVAIGTVVSLNRENVGIRVYDVDSGDIRDVTYGGAFKVIKGGVNIENMMVTSLSCSYKHMDGCNPAVVISGVGIGYNSYTLIAKGIGDEWRVVDVSGNVVDLDSRQLFKLYLQGLNANFICRTKGNNVSVVYECNLDSTDRAKISSQREKAGRLFGKRTEWLEHSENGGVAFKKLATDTNIDIPEGETFIENNGFCKSPVESVKLPSSMKMLGDCSFYNSKLKNIELNEGLERICSHSFAYCKNLKELRLPSTLRNIGLNVILSSGVAKVYAPKCLVAYGVLTNVIWGKYCKIEII